MNKLPNLGNTVVVLTPDNMHGAFNQDGVEVWCPFAKQEAMTNDGFCQFCGKTDHETVAAHDAHDAAPATDQQVRAIDLRVDHINRVMSASVPTETSIYQLHGLIVWIKFDEDAVWLGVSEKPDEDTYEWEFIHEDLITIETGK